MNKVSKIMVLLTPFIFSFTCQAHASFEVKGKGVSSTLWVSGEAETSKSNDEVIYLVDPEKKIVTRTAVVNVGIKDGIGAGLVTDHTVYDIVYDKEMTALDLMQKNVKKPQKVIKAIGRAGTIDGFETIVIGDDFIVTSNSKYDYFILYHYNRVY